jgi:hypothetical protein
MHECANKMSTLNNNANAHKVPKSSVCTVFAIISRQIGGNIYQIVTETKNLLGTEFLY